MSILEGDVEEYHPEWQFGGVKASQGARSKGMATRDAGDYGWNLTFEEAVTKARSERWEDPNIVALLAWRKPAPTLEDVRRVPKVAEKIKIGDLQFRVDDTGGGGMIVEYRVDGRPKTQLVPLMVGQVLEAQTIEILTLQSFVKELEARLERYSGFAGVDGDGGFGKGSAKRGTARAAKKAKANT